MRTPTQIFKNESANVHEHASAQVYTHLRAHMLMHMSIVHVCMGRHAAGLLFDTPCHPRVTLLYIIIIIIIYYASNFICTGTVHVPYGLALYICIDAIYYI